MFCYYGESCFCFFLPLSHSLCLFCAVTGLQEYVTNVKAVKLRRDRIAVVLEHHVYVYDLKYLKKLHQYETYPNPKGLAALCPNSTNSVLAFPGLQQGHVHIELYDQKKQTIIDAHDGPLSALALNLDGTRLATASEKGTLLRIFDTQSGDLLQELRRGADRAEINNLAFNSNSTWLACSSDKGTIHVFALGEAVSNPKSTLSFMKDFLPKYFSSEWSLAQFHVPDSRSICAFGAEAHSIIVVCSDGSYYKAVFDPKAGGEMRQVSYDRFIAADPHAPGAGGVAVSTGGVLGGDMNEVGGVSRDAVNTSTETATTAGGAHDATLTVGASSTAATEGGMTGGSTSTVGGGMDNDANLDIVGPGASESGPQAIREA